MYYTTHFSRRFFVLLFLLPFCIPHTFVFGSDKEMKIFLKKTAILMENFCNHIIKSEKKPLPGTYLFTYDNQPLCIDYTHKAQRVDLTINNSQEEKRKVESFTDSSIIDLLHQNKHLTFKDKAVIKLIKNLCYIRHAWHDAKFQMIVSSTSVVFINNSVTNTTTISAETESIIDYNTHTYSSILN